MKKLYFLFFALFSTSLHIKTTHACEAKMRARLTQKVSWTGQCVGGLVHGFGVLSGKTVSASFRFKGTMEKGYPATGELRYKPNGYFLGEKAPSLNVGIQRGWRSHPLVKYLFLDEQAPDNLLPLHFKIKPNWVYIKELTSGDIKNNKEGEMVTFYGKEGQSKTYEFYKKGYTSQTKTLTFNNDLITEAISLVRDKSDANLSHQASEKKAKSILSKVNGDLDGALWHASEKIDDPGVFSYLIKSGANVNSQREGGNTPLMLVSSRDPKVEVVKTLVNLGADINGKNSEGITPLMFAALKCNNPNLVKVLIKLGAEINARNGDGLTPLMLASGHNKKMEIIKELIMGGAKVNDTDMKGQSPLGLAAYRNQSSEVTRVLIESGADVNLKDSNGQGPLILAAAGNPNPDVIAELIKAGVDVNPWDADGVSPLHMAALQNTNPEVIKVLVEAGADLEAKARGEVTVEATALRNKNPKVHEMVKTLQRVKQKGGNQTKENSSKTNVEQDSDLDADNLKSELKKQEVTTDVIRDESNSNVKSYVRQIRAEFRPGFVERNAEKYRSQMKEFDIIFYFRNKVVVGCWIGYFNGANQARTLNDLSELVDSGVLNESMNFRPKFYGGLIMDVDVGETW